MKKWMVVCAIVCSLIVQGCVLVFAPRGAFEPHGAPPPEEFEMRERELGQRAEEFEMRERELNERTEQLEMWERELIERQEMIEEEDDDY